MKQRRSYGLWQGEHGLSWAEVNFLGDGRWELISKGRLEAAGERMPVAAARSSITGMVPGSRVQLGQPKLPRLRGREMERALAVWAARESDTEISDLAAAWRSYEVEGDSTADRNGVLLAHCSRNWMQEFTQPWLTRGAEVEVLLPDYLIFDQVLRAARPDIAEMQAWCFVHLAQEESFVSIATREALLFHRSLPNDASGELNPGHVERLATEILRSVHRARQSKANLSIDAFFLEGDGGLGELLASKLKESQSASIRSFALEDLLDDSTAELDPGLCMAVAAAMATNLDLGGMNLLPRRRKGILAPKAVKRIGAAAAVLAGVLLPLAVVGGLVSERRSGSRLESMSAAIEELLPVITEAEHTGRLWRITLERERVSAGHDLGAAGLELVLADLALRTPDQIRLETLRVIEREDRRILQVSGVSTDEFNEQAQKAFLAFTASLDESGYLQRGDLPSRISIEELDPHLFDDAYDEESSDQYDEEAGEGSEKALVEQSIRKRVVFSLEYEIARDDGTKGGA